MTDNQFSGCGRLEVSHLAWEGLKNGLPEKMTLKEALKSGHGGTIPAPRGAAGAS
jgi:hypothetical protein